MPRPGYVSPKSPLASDPSCGTYMPSAFFSKSLVLKCGVGVSVAVYQHPRIAVVSFRRFRWHHHHALQASGWKRSQRHGSFVSCTNSVFRIRGSIYCTSIVISRGRYYVHPCYTDRHNYLVWDQALLYVDLFLELPTTLRVSFT